MLLPVLKVREGDYYPECSAWLKLVRPYWYTEDSYVMDNNHVNALILKLPSFKYGMWHDWGMGIERGPVWLQLYLVIHFYDWPFKVVTFWRTVHEHNAA